MNRVIVFDLDDTLFSEHDFVYSGFRAVGNWIAERYDSHGFCETAWSLFKEGKRGTVFNLALEQLSLNLQPTLIQEMVEIYRTHQPKLSLYEDAVWAINYLSAQCQLGIITDGYLKTQKNKVRALGLAPLFHTIIYSDFYGRENWKPSPVPYLKMMQLNGEPESEYVYIGDNPTKDFVTAKQLNWLTVQICREQGEYSNIEVQDAYAAHFKISSLIELKDILL